jgi:hypothetical protein
MKDAVYTEAQREEELARREDSFRRMLAHRACRGGRSTAISLGLMSERQASRPDAQPKQQLSWLLTTNC